MSPSPSPSISTSTGINMNIILFLVISLGFLLSECVCVGQTLNCGCSTSCTSNILDSFAGEYTCRDRINYLINSESYTEANACRLVAGTEFPCVCGPFCDPDRCDTAIVPRTPAPTQPPAPAPSSLYCFPDDDGNGSRVTYTNMWDGDFTVQVKEGNVCGPGGNRFTQDTVSVSTGNQALVLQFKKNGAFWEASEVRIIKPDNSPFKYGEYSFHVNSVKVKDSSDNIISNVLPANIVLGLFTWDPTDDYAMHQNWNHEVDIEISKWGIPDNKDVQFLMQPPGDPQMYRFYSGDGSNTYDQSDQTYSFNWLPNKISWSSTAGGGQTHIYTTEDAVLKGCTDYVQCLPADIEIRINLWSIDGLTAAPQGLSDTDSIEVVLDDFTYQESNVEYASPGDYCSKHCQCEAELGCVNGQCITIVTPPTPTPEPTQSPTQHPTPAAPTTSPTPDGSVTTPAPVASPGDTPAPVAVTTPAPAPYGCADTTDLFYVTKPDGTVIFNRDCAWVGEQSFRCDFAGAPENCPLTCDTCPGDECSEDTTDRFDVTKPDGTVIFNRDCAWIGEQSFRCGFAGAPENCPATCNACSLECVDTTGIFDVTKPDGTLISNRSCAWISQHSFRCGFAGATENCPYTCDACYPECADTTNRFDVTKPNGVVISSVNCAWVSQHSFRCGFAGAAENCPTTCDTCSQVAPVCVADSLESFDVTKPNGVVISSVNCAWVSQHSAFRCAFAGAAENCPVICNLCKF